MYKCENEDYELNLHSTMLLLYHCESDRSDHEREIYIPLCFYFIRLLVASELISKLEIYIPLCFYFIKEQRTLWLRFTNIYIPLCFYFIRTYSARGYGWHRHLHSTMLLLYPVGGIFGTHVPVFTFHYASTLSKNGKWTERTWINLHSTMLLLYLTSGSLSWMGNIIYIPLCFYFIYIGDVVVIENKEIYIPLCFYFIRCPLFLRHVQIADLHSTMLLLYLLCRNRIQPALIHLHSTMLLLYHSVSPWRTIYSLIIYIPLCFYFITYPLLPSLPL